MLSTKHCLSKLCIIAFFVTILSLMIYNKDTITDFLVNQIVPHIQENAFPYSYHINRIDTNMQEIINLDDSVQYIVVYKFNKDKNTKIIVSQEGIAFKNRYPERKISNYMYLIDKKNNTFQELLLNKVHFENIYTSNNECSQNYDPKNFTCAYVKSTGVTYDTVITIPILDTKGYEIVGYTMITVDKPCNKFEVELLVNKIKDQMQFIGTELNKL